MNLNTTTALPACLCLLFAFGCAEDFAPYELVAGPRLLAVGADAPAVLPGDTTTLSVLLTDESLEPQWSWCPIFGAGTEGYPCLSSEEELQQAINAVVGDDSVTVPSFNLGSGQTAEFESAVPMEIWQGFCTLAQEQNDLPFTLPDCRLSFQVGIKVEVDIGDRTLAAVRQLDLLYDSDAEQNQAPVLDGVSAFLDVDGQEIVLDPDNPPVLARETEYTIRVQIDDSSAENYEDFGEDNQTLETQREDLRFSWFHEGGEWDRSASSFLDGSIPIEEAAENVWLTPTVEEQEEDTARLFIIVRDGRGGTSWIVRTVGLE